MPDETAQASAAGQDPGPSFSRLAGIIADLREHCPWTAALTHESLVEYLIEEAYEVVEAVEDGTMDREPAELKAELGDVLLQVVLHARLQEERGGFTLSAVADGLSDKMVRRNQHVFAPDGTLRASFPAAIDEIVRAWDAAKAVEKPGRSTPFDGIPASLPALLLASKSLERAERSGASDAGQEPVPESGSGLRGGPPETEAELGRMLFALVRTARNRGLDPERALRAAVRSYQQSFR